MNKIYDTLYSKDSVGNIRIWYMEQQDNRYRTVSGIKEGQLVTSEFTECQGKNEGKKNETSGVTQAIAEINARYKKQLKLDYFKSESEVDNSNFVQPTLAKSLKDYEDKIDFTKNEWWLQIKFNGSRAVATKDFIKSRTGEIYKSVPHIEKSLKAFFDKQSNLVLDGEFYSYEHRQELNSLMTLVRKTVNITEQDLKESEEKVRYYVYDGYLAGDAELGESAPYEKRKAWLDENLIGKYKYIEEVKSYPISSREELDKYYQTFIDDNQEGGILRYKLSDYQHKRTKYLLKMKELNDAEAEIVDINEGVGNWAGTGKIITLKWNGKVFNSTSKGTQKQCIELLENKDKYIGKQVTFIFNGFTGNKGGANNIPNYARVDLNNCWKGFKK